MDEGLDIEARKQALVRALDLSRHEVLEAKKRLTQKVNAPKRFVGSVQNNPKPWLLGAGVSFFLVGAAVRTVFRPRRKSKRGGIVSSLVKTAAFSLAKPYIKTFLVKQGADFVKNQLSKRGIAILGKSQGESSLDSPLGHRRDL